MFTFFHGCGIPPMTMTCPPAGGAQAQTVYGPTGTQGCTMPGHCVGPTGTQHCTIVGPTGTQGCTIVGPTGWLGCGHDKGAQAQTILGPTGTYGCTMPGHCVGPTGTYGCTSTIVGPTAWLGCGQDKGAQAQANVGVTGAQGCTMVGPTGTYGCTSTTIYPTQFCHTVNPAVCPTMICPTATTSPGGANAQTILPVTMPGHCYGPTGTYGCTATTTVQTIACPTATTVINTTVKPEGANAHAGAPTHLIGCTGYQGCGHQDGGAAQAQIPTVPVADCIPTRHCTGAWPIC